MGDRVKPVDAWGIVRLAIHFGHARHVDGDEISIISIINKIYFILIQYTIVHKENLSGKWK